MEPLTIAAALGLLAGSFVLPIRWLYSGQSQVRKELSDFERRTVSRNDMERLITLYTDPIKEDIAATKKGVEGLIEKFQRLEVMIAREFGHKHDEAKQKKL